MQALLRRLWRSRTRGVALFELICALGLVAVLIAGAVMLYQSATHSNAQARLVQLSHELRGGVERIFTGRASYSGAASAATRELLCEAGVVPEENLVGSACSSARWVTHLSAWSGSTGHSVRVWQLRLPGDPAGSPKGFQLGFRALDDGDCEALVGAYVGRNWNRSNFFGSTVRPATDWSLQSGSASHWVRAPLTQTNVNSLCSRGSGNNNVYLGFR